MQPDLFRKEGVEYRIGKITDIYREITRQLNAETRLGPIPKKMKFYAETDIAVGVGEHRVEF